MNLLVLKVVLAAIERDESSAAVLRAARELADASGAQLHVVHVASRSDATDRAADEIERTALDAVVALLDRANVRIERAQIHVIGGEPAHAIRSLSDRIRADVIVLGPHRETRGHEKQIGSTALAIATASWAPCLIVTRDLRLPLAHVLVPIDLSDTARGALMVALSWSSALRRRTRGADGGEASSATQLTALYVDRAERQDSGSVRTPHALEAELDRVQREAGKWAGVAIEGVTTASTDVAGAIAERARADHADLIVLGTRGLGLDAVGRLGSVSDAVLRRAEAPVLLVPPAVWEQHGRAS